MMLLTDAIAFVAAVFLMLEWRVLRERFLLDFALGFSCIAVGCTIAPMREGVSFLVGIWFANTMVPLAHYFFLRGAASFVSRPISRLWLTMLWLCAAGLLLVPAADYRDQVYSLVNAGLVAIFCLTAARLLLTPAANRERRMLGATLAAHGGFYAIKAVCAFVPGAFVDLARYQGVMVTLSLFEGVFVAVALAMSIAGVLRQRRESQAMELAEIDSLTGLFNRRGFRLRAGLALRREDGCGALLILDVDHFKSINDRFGHLAGDQHLARLGGFLRRRAPSGAIVARLGGDEFAMLVPGMDEIEAARFARELCEGFVAHAESGNSGTLSIGCAAYDDGDAEIDRLLREADISLYQAKRNGRNQSWSNGENDLPSETVVSFAAIA
ncbi:sensor domain-containing diguanylate cyclase [Novosphingobium sp. 9]|uniref:GGDEF domain-containing protein n=1 Tax=Novosphingobium sp. 9 TaxID=2025349 RepID=UPI0021B69F96|nr:GGDEF domain-containing protein [Novosphingobium sp. 9]